MSDQARTGRWAALYTPYLDVLGGGEMHVLSILKVLEEIGVEVFVFWDEDLSYKIEKNLGLKFKRLKFLPNIFKKRSLLKNAFYLSRFEIFLYVPDGSYFFSLAKKNFLFCMVPEKKLYEKNFLNRLKLWNFRILANSKFTAKYLQKWLGKKVEVIYPYLSSEILKLKLDLKEKKERVINIGRFFKQLHSKKQDIIIKWFKKIKQEENKLKKINLYLVGRLKEEDKKFINEIKKEIGEREDICLKVNVSRKDVLDFLASSKYYWHFTGLDEKDKPQKQEHLGISLLEAMALGCVVFAHKGGGPKEIIMEGKTGFLFEDYAELKGKFLKVFQDKNLQEKIIRNAREFVQKDFSYKVFRKKVVEVLVN